LHVKIQIITIIITTSLKKQFRVEEFLNQFNIFNSKEIELKQIIITALDKAINHQLIKALFKIIKTDRDRSVIKTTQLTTRDLNQIKIIYS
jgi:hypothetical protein